MNLKFSNSKRGKDTHELKVSILKILKEEREKGIQYFINYNYSQYIGFYIHFFRISGKYIMGMAKYR